LRKSSENAAIVNVFFFNSSQSINFIMSPKYAAPKLAIKIKKTKQKSVFSLFTIPTKAQNV